MSGAAAVWSNSRSTNPRRAAGARAMIQQRRHTPRVEARATAAEESEAIKLMKNCDHRVYSLALRITRNHHDAEDARQETLLKAYRHIEQFEGRSRFTTWISRIAINEGLMTIRRRKDNRRVPLDEITEIATESDTLLQIRPPAENPEESFCRRQLRSVLDAAIAGLRPLHRDVFVLRTVDELSTSETAKILGVTVSAVKTRLRRARVELRSQLA